MDTREEGVPLKTLFSQVGGPSDIISQEAEGPVPDEAQLDSLGPGPMGRVAVGSTESRHAQVGLGHVLSAPLPQHPQACRWLSPFLLVCSIYFLWTPEHQPSCLGALLKCLPVFCLVVFLGAVPPTGGRTRLLQGALLCSAVGDACLMWPETFLHGMAAFAAAHLLYLWAFGLRPLRPGLLLVAFLTSAAYLSLLLPHLEPAMAQPVVAYAMVLAAMLWRGLACGGSAGHGALLFTVSDAVLAWNSFVRPLPQGRLVTMSTYYVAQALLALSALGSPGRKTD